MNGAVETFLHGKRILSFDSMAIIYFIEENAQYLPILETIFEKVDSGSLRALSSYITLIEVLTKPISERRFDLVDAYRNRLIGSEGFTLFPVERQVSERAAHLRASYRLKTPDAIQIATAIEYGAEAFVTNEPQLTRVREIQVVTLGQFS